MPAITGILTRTLDAATVVGVAAPNSSGAGSATLLALAAAGVGTVAVGGQSALTLDDLIASGIGTVLIGGQSALTLDDLIASGIGTVRIAGALAIALGELTAGAIGTAEDRQLGFAVIAITTWSPSLSIRFDLKKISLEIEGTMILGADRLIRATFTMDGLPIAAENVVLKLRRTGGGILIVTEDALENPGVGVYGYTYRPNAHGRWHVRVEGQTDAGLSVEEAEFQVYPTKF